MEVRTPLKHTRKFTTSKLKQRRGKSEELGDKMRTEQHLTQSEQRQTVHTKGNKFLQTALPNPYHQSGQVNRNYGTPPAGNETNCGKTVA